MKAMAGDSSPGMFIQLLDAVENSNPETLSKLLQSKDLNLNYVDDNGYTVLQRAVEKASKILKMSATTSCNSKSSLFETAVESMSLHGDSDSSKNSIIVVRHLIESGAQVNSIDRNKSEKDPPLLLAIKGGHLEVCKLLCRHGADVNVKSTYQQAPALVVAAKEGKNDLINILLEHKADVNMCAESSLDENVARSFNFENSALFAALSHGHLDCVKQLLSCGARLDLETAMQSAILQRHADALRLFVEHMPLEAKLQMKCSWATQSLRLACQKGQLEIVKILLELGADPNCTDRLGRTPLMLSSDPEISKILIQYGADVCAKFVSIGGEEMCVLDVAIGNGWLLVVEALIHADAEVSKETFLKAVTMPKKKGNTELILILLQAGACANWVDSEGIPALHHAAFRNRDILPALVDFGADVNKPLPYTGDSVLLSLARMARPGDCIALKMLVKQGADINFVNSTRRQSAMCILMDKVLDDTKEWYECVQALIELGAKGTESCNLALVRSIQRYKVQAAHLIIKTGTGPHCIHLSHISFNRYGAGMFGQTLVPGWLDGQLTPFVLSLVCGKMFISKFMLDNLFLSTTDIHVVPRNCDLRLHLQDHGFTDCLALVNTFFSRPRSLFELSFIHLSTLLGTAPGREDKVRSLGLPLSLQQKLLFRN